MSLPLARIDEAPAEDRSGEQHYDPELHPPVQDGGFIAALRANLKGQKDEGDWTTPLPTLGDYGPDGMLIPRIAVRYRRLDPDEMDAWQSVEATKLEKSADLLADACVEIYAIDDGENKPLSGLLGLDAPVRFDMAFADALGVPVSVEEGTRGVVLAAFTKREVALATHAQYVLEWIVGAHRAPEKDLLGKS